MMPAARHGHRGEDAVLVGQGHTGQFGGRLHRQDHHGVAHWHSRPASSSPARPPRPGQVDRHPPLLLVPVLIGGESHRERVTTEHGLGHVAPLHHGDGVVLDQLADGEVGDLAEVLQSIEIGMEEGAHRRDPVDRVPVDRVPVHPVPVDRAGRHRVRAHEREGRARDVVGDPEADRDPLGQRGLPRPQVAGEEHHVAGSQAPGQGGAQGPGVVGRLGPQPHRGGLPGGRAHGGSPMRSRLARTKSARISATTSAPPRKPAAGWYVGTR